MSRATNPPSASAELPLFVNDAGLPIVSPEIAEAAFSVRCVAGKWPLSDTHVQVLVQEMFPPESAAVLHDASPKAHTFTFDCASDGTGAVRVATLTPLLSAQLLSFAPRTIHLKVGAYEISAEGWNVSTHDTLYGLLGRPLGRRLGLEALTPVRLGVGADLPLPLPLPWALFQEPVACWAAFAPDLPQPPEDLREWQHRHLTLSRFEIRTATVSAEGQEEPGFVGPFEITVSQRNQRDQEWAWTNLLASYAHFTGVGKRRARGAGRLRRL